MRKKSFITIAFSFVFLLLSCSNDDNYMEEQTISNSSKQVVKNDSSDDINAVKIESLQAKVYSEAEGDPSNPRPPRNR